MLDYLVTSEARKQLLKTLWINESEASVSQLAEQTHLSFSTTYEELKAMAAAGLATSEHLGKTVVFRANRSHPKAHLLTELLVEQNEPLASSSEDAFDVLAHLEHLGAPVAVTTQSTHSMSNEETVARSLALARQNATVARVLPLVLHNYWDRLDWDKVQSLAVRSGQKRTLGFFLELTSYLSKEPGPKRRARNLHDRRVKRTESFFLNSPKGAFARRLEAKNTPPVAKRWHFTMNMDLGNFESHFRKFAQSVEHEAVH